MLNLTNSSTYFPRSPFKNEIHHWLSDLRIAGSLNSGDVQYVKVAMRRRSNELCGPIQVEGDSFEPHLLPTDSHPGWNVEDRANLVPYEECRFLVELIFRQIAVIHLKSSQPVDVVVCSDDDYEHYGAYGGNHTALNSASGVGAKARGYRFAFQVPRSGIYDIIVTNPCGEDVAMTIQIIVPAKGLRY